MKLKIINACSDLGVHINGSENGPLKFKKITEKENISTVIKKNIEKELDKENKRKNIKAVNDFNERLFDIIKKEEDFVITIGGDHSIAIGSALASLYKSKNLGIIWIDSHADFHNLETTISGNIHGMPFATICGQNGKELSNFFKGDYYDCRNAVLVGGRDIESPEYKNLEKAGVKIFTTQDIKKYGAKEIMKKAFDIAKVGTKGVHISYDLDVIDPKEAPGVSIKAKDGISKKEALEILESIIEEKNNIRSFDLVEFNPNRDVDDKTYRIAEEILSKLVKEIKNI